MGTFVLKTGKNGDLYFNLKAGNGQVILSSQGYSSEASRKNGIASVRENSVIDERYIRKTSTDGKVYFTLNAGNGQVIGTSEMYESDAGCEKGIASVKANAPDADLKEE